jgi:hypothetical protein
MRLVGARQVDWQERRQFLAVAARTTRQALDYENFIGHQTTISSITEWACS